MGKTNKQLLAFLLAIAVCGGIIASLLFYNSFLRENKRSLEKEVVQTIKDFSAANKRMRDEINTLKRDVKDLVEVLESIRSELATTTLERDYFEEKYNLEKGRMDDLSSQIGNIQNKVGTLEKLSQTDPELLKKYSRVYFLNENYAPESFIRINPEYTFDPKEDYLIYSKIWPFLENLMSAAIADEIDIKIVSAYRSFNDQSELKKSYKMIYGSGADRFSADQGYSEHQLGTTIDFTALETGVRYNGFEKTAAYQWLKDNAHIYGFILSYPPDNDYYQFESWHWRFVGRALAEKLHSGNNNFYDLDQREINEYLISFFD